MVSHKLSDLVEKFWSGETTRDEEEYLYELLSDQDDLDDELVGVRNYLSYTDQQGETVSLDEEFTREVISEIKALERPSIRKFKWLSVAASLILVISLCLWFDDQYSLITSEKEVVVSDTFDDPEMAFQEVKKVMMLLSSNMGQGVEHTGLLGEFYQVKNKLEGKN
ncbi:MAG: hypothetical protein R3275_12570 [Saprospiraceae bacterium]|nr:hypothetical protein [Saprospiraceae bacterium]